jgi:hypothetical protein
MDLKHYIPISIGVFAAVVLAARYFGLPPAPFVFILLIGETMLGLQMENQKIFRFLEDLARAFKPTRKAR